MGATLAGRSSSGEDAFVSGFRNVSSKAVYSIYYIPVLNMLEVVFRSNQNTVYQYHDFKSSDFARLLDAYSNGNSLGSYFHEYVKDCFPVACALTRNTK
jgi:hypothetical protein